MNYNKLNIEVLLQMKFYVENIAPFSFWELIVHDYEKVYQLNLNNLGKCYISISLDKNEITVQEFAKIIYELQKELNIKYQILSKSVLEILEKYNLL